MSVRIYVQYYWNPFLPGECHDTTGVHTSLVNNDKLTWSTVSVAHLEYLEYLENLEYHFHHLKAVRFVNAGGGLDISFTLHPVCYLKWLQFQGHSAQLGGDPCQEIPLKAGSQIYSKWLCVVRIMSWLLLMASFLSSFWSWLQRSLSIFSSDSNRNHVIIAYSEHC